MSISNFDKDISNWESAVRQNPSDLGAKRNLASAYFNKRVIYLKPNILGEGNFLTSKNDVLGFLDCVRKAYEITPNTPQDQSDRSTYGEWIAFAEKQLKIETSFSYFLMHIFVAVAGILIGGIFSITWLHIASFILLILSIVASIHPGWMATRLTAFVTVGGDFGLGTAILLLYVSLFQRF